MPFGLVRSGGKTTLPGDVLVFPVRCEDQQWREGLRGSFMAICDSRLMFFFAREGFQGSLTAICDCDSCAFLCLVSSARQSGPEASGTLHRWLWRLSPVHGPVVPREEFADAVEIRLGAAMVTPVTVCTRCGVVLTACVCMALLVLSLPEAASEIRDFVLECAHVADI